ncbi:hypothetical protein PUN28_007221 [Cardiocondyla obscurior]|uniref:Uncharacterized protein n=1 Tax=Cardiocondyla obscurior TaxID=286306 RepID=A0AAW2G5R1_9HYME
MRTTSVAILVASVTIRLNSRIYHSGESLFMNNCRNAGNLSLKEIQTTEANLSLIVRSFATHGE